MSENSVAALRQIGVRRNQDAQANATVKKPGPVAALLAKLPGRRAAKASPESQADHTDGFRVSDAYGHGGLDTSSVSAAPVSAMEASDQHAPEAPVYVENPPSIDYEPATPPSPVRSSASPVGAEPDVKAMTAPLKQSSAYHMAAGGGAGALALLAATGTPLIGAGGLVFGALAGRAAFVRATGTGKKVKTFKVAPKKALLLSAIVERVAEQVAHADVKSLSISADAAMQVDVSNPARGSDRPNVKVSIGILLLQVLNTQQLTALLTHRVQAAIHPDAKTHREAANAAAALETWCARMEQRSKFFRLGNWEKACQTLKAHRGAVRAQQLRALSDDDDALIAAHMQGPLVEALIAAGVVDSLHHLALHELGGKAALTQAYKALSLPVEVANVDVDGLLKDACTRDRGFVEGDLPWLLNLPTRAMKLDPQSELPPIPSGTAVWTGIDESYQRKIGKALGVAVGISKPRHANSGSTNGSVNPLDRVDRREDETMSNKSGGLFNRKAGRSEKKTSKAGDSLEHADRLYLDSPGKGLEAYRQLADDNPRWAVVHARLGEAQIECGDPEGLKTLLECTHTLPSALPSLIETLTSALSMAGPLDGEAIRGRITQLAPQATAIAEERQSIDLARLETSMLDTLDRSTLTELFDRLDSLREVWAFNMPSVHMPEVPHHAFIALAPRRSHEDAAFIGEWLADRAAILGTSAFYIETGTPSGPLGDVLAGASSMWRAKR